MEKKVTETIEEKRARWAKQREEHPEWPKPPEISEFMQRVNQMVEDHRKAAAEEKQNDIRKEIHTQMTGSAIRFAVAAHAGQTRKGSSVPYITHPIEVAIILAQMGANDELIAAGLLHDTLEDTGTTVEELEKAFGKHVLALVQSDSENKTFSWEERKQATLDALQSAGREEQMLALADKLANMRSIAEDYSAVGDALWQRFNRGYEQQKWYYTGLYTALGALTGLAAYAEFGNLIERVFECLTVTIGNE